MELQFVADFMTRSYFVEETKPCLGGEAVEGSVAVRDGYGQLVDPGRAICPIVTETEDGQWELIGTGFFITTYGVIATAKHVVVDRNCNAVCPIALVQFLPNDSYVLRPVLRWCIHKLADTAVGIAAPMTDHKSGSELKAKVCPLTLSMPQVGERCCTYAYPKPMMSPQQIHFLPAFYDGRIEEYYPNGRDRSSLPSPCWRTRMFIHGGASGGPVFDANGKVFGINSKGITGAEDISFVSRIEDILSLRVRDLAFSDQRPSDFTIAELARRGHISTTPPLNSTSDGSKSLPLAL